MPKNQKYHGLVSRAAAVDPAIMDDTGRSIRTVVATENPVMMMDWENWEPAREILLMDGVSLPDNNQIPLLDNHSRYDSSSVIGSIRDLQVVGTELVGNSVFVDGDPNVDQIWQRVKQGHLTDVSVGYQTFDANTFRIPPGQNMVINGRTISNNFGDDKTLIVRTKWQPKEGSTTPIGADAAAKFRSEMRITSEDPELQKAIDEALRRREEINIKEQIKITSNERKANMPDKTPEEIRKEEGARRDGIADIGKRFANNYKPGNIDAAIRKAIDDNSSVDQFRAHVFDNFDDTKPVGNTATAIDAPRKEAEQFSVTRAINAAVEERLSEGSGWKGAPRELEMCNEAKSRAIAAGLKPRGLVLPLDAMFSRALPHLNIDKRTAKQLDLSKRAMTVGSATGGQYLVGTEHLGNLFIPLLRNKAVTSKAGVRMLSGLKGNIEIPKQTGAASFNWLSAEAGAANNTNMTIGHITMSPRDGSANTTYGRRLLLQSDPTVDALVIDDLIKIAALGLDKAVLHGAGINGEPLGVAGVSGVGSVDGTNLGWNGVVEFETDIENANADLNTLNFITNPAIKGLLKTRPKIGTTYPTFLMDGNGQLNGYNSLVTNQVNSGFLFFGDWSNAWMGEWGMVDILINPYKDETGNITITVFLTVDIAVSQAGGFSVSDNVN